jgi:hypothetical protein
LKDVLTVYTAATLVEQNPELGAAHLALRLASLRLSDRGAAHAINQPTLVRPSYFRSMLDCELTTPRAAVSQSTSFEQQRELNIEGLKTFAMVILPAEAAYGMRRAPRRPPTDLDAEVVNAVLAPLTFDQFEFLERLA